MDKDIFDVVIIGGGAAGFFTAINAAEINPSLRILIVERGKNVLEKVRISGGGRCNVTHACFEPKPLTAHYPRGEKELLGPFHQFCSGDTVAWFEDRGVALVAEEDGRMFPEANTSQAIIDCFLKLASQYQIKVNTSESVQELLQNTSGKWEITTSLQRIKAHKIVVAAGSNPKMWQLLAQLGHTIVAPVPSLFTFNIQNKALTQLMGNATEVSVAIKDSNFSTNGRLLITHWGISGPAVLKLSAWAARFLAEKKYVFEVCINWLSETTLEASMGILKGVKETAPKRQIMKQNPFGLTNRLWEYLVTQSGIEAGKSWANCTHQEIEQLSAVLTQNNYWVNGKSTFKEEFVTAGGIELKEINFKTMQSKIANNLYFAGEVMNIDAITGGFNFQNAWTTSYIAAQHIATND